MPSLNGTSYLEIAPPQRIEAPPDNPTASPRQSWYTVAKGPADYCLALLLLVLTAPLVLLAMLAVKLTSRGSVFYMQTRLGLNGKPFAIYKIRTMIQNCEKTSGAVWCIEGDPRVTLVGRFLRASHIDELPQLWNILRGEMSLIGPRPERPEFVAPLTETVHRYGERLSVKPGITGLAQVQLPADSDMEDVRRKVAHDLYYIEHLSWWLDFRILCSTALVVFRLPYRFSRYLFALPNRDLIQQIYAISENAEAAQRPEPVKIRERESA